jgi:aerobic carbon-monoxide dehydrogenase small subunit
MVATDSTPKSTTATPRSSRVLVTTRINGEETELLCETRQSLLETLRETAGLTGTKEGCNDGNCGACSVLLNGRLVNSCLVLGVEAEGAEITTVEGLATPSGLHPLQTAFLEQAALQCGICTPGFLVAAKALLDKEPNPTEERVRFWLAGNLCRCTGYDKIVRAVMQAAQMRPALASNGAAANGASNGHSGSNGAASA